MLESNLQTFNCSAPFATVLPRRQRIKADTHTYTNTHTHASIPSPKSPSCTHVGPRKRSSTGPNKWQILINTLCPNTRVETRLDTSGLEHVSPRSIQPGWAIKLQIIRVLVQSCTSGHLCLDRASVVLHPLELKKLIVPGMLFNYT